MNQTCEEGSLAWYMRADEIRRIMRDFFKNNIWGHFADEQFAEFICQQFRNMNYVAVWENISNSNRAFISVRNK